MAFVVVIGLVVIVMLNGDGGSDGSGCGARSGGFNGGERGGDSASINDGKAQL